MAISWGGPFARHLGAAVFARQEATNTSDSVANQLAQFNMLSKNETVFDRRMLVLRLGESSSVAGA
jgi:hypothetical protein